MTLPFEWFVADLVGPACGADGFTKQRPTPSTWLTRIGTIPGKGGGLEIRPAVPLLTTQPRQVSQGWAPVGPAEVDNENATTVDQPVAWLPVAVCGNERCRRSVMAGDDLSEARLGARVDAVFAIQPSQRAIIHLPLVLVINP